MGERRWDVALKTLPLGVDLGSSRVRVAALEQTPHGPALRAVATRDIFESNDAEETPFDPGYVGLLVEDAVRELDTRERRAVCAIGLPAALLFDIDLPKMRPSDRRQAAYFEAARFIEYPLEEAAVHLNGKPGEYNVGVARRDDLSARSAALRSAGLRVLAIDHESYALLRAYPRHDAVLDIGLRRAALHVKTNRSPQSFSCSSGGEHITRAVARDLELDEPAAEKRKRILGTAGAGERARIALIAELASLVRAAQASTTLTKIALAGNASRLPGLDAALERACGVRVELALSEVLNTTSYPQDVLRSACPDWTLAASLALWERTA